MAVSVASFSRTSSLGSSGKSDELLDGPAGAMPEEPLGALEVFDCAGAGDSVGAAEVSSRVRLSTRAKRSRSSRSLMSNASSALIASAHAMSTFPLISFRTSQSEDRTMRPEGSLKISCTLPLASGSENVVFRRTSVSFSEDAAMLLLLLRLLSEADRVPCLAFVHVHLQAEVGH